MQSVLERISDSVGTALLGKENQVKLSLACLLSEGHLLIEDLPGMGKTTLAQCLATVLGLQYSRVQFTSDLLPGDIIGVSVFDRNDASFKFHKGPVFTQLLLADEINRSTPKAQSALLEAMEERQVTVDGKTRKLPEPFFVIATQNPVSQAGTYPLPESQLDRFLMCVSLGYPTAESERKLLKGLDPREELKTMKPIVNLEELKSLQTLVKDIKATDQLLDYLQRLVNFTRYSDKFSYGLSPRGALGLLRASKAWALIHNRDYVIPEDLQAIIPSVVEHRVQGSSRVHSQNSSDSLSTLLLNSVEVVER
ncbi:MAG: MoxR-like ATPase [Flavobacteriales bacterium]|jgi:MoxR-like ATPase